MSFHLCLIAKPVQATFVFKNYNLAYKFDDTLFLQIKIKSDQTLRGSLEKNWPSSSMSKEGETGFLIGLWYKACDPMVFYYQKVSLRNSADNVQHFRFSPDRFPSMIFQRNKRLIVTLLLGAEFYPYIPYLVPEVSSLSLLSFSKGSGKFPFFPL